MTVVVGNMISDDRHDINLENGMRGIAVIGPMDQGDCKAVSIKIYVAVSSGKARPKATE